MEEELKILEEFKKNGYSMLVMKYGDRNKANLKLENALENIIKRYKGLEAKVKRYEKYIQKQKEKTEELLEYEYQERELDYIPKAKIEEKIKELEREFDFYAGREHFEWQDGEFDGEVCDDIALKIGVLRKLLESE